MYIIIGNLICCLLLQPPSTYAPLNPHTWSFRSNEPPVRFEVSVDRSTAPQFVPSAPKPGDNSDQLARQKVVLLEEERRTLKTARYSGSAVWRTEAIRVNPERSPEIAVRADIEIPSRLNVRFSLGRSEDPALAGNYTISIIFTMPEGISRAGIASVPGILMQEGELTTGVPLAGRTAKVSNNFFLVNLTPTASEMRKNIQLLKERSWVVLPFVYANGVRAIITIEKGASGERTFSDGFAMWGDPIAPTTRTPAKTRDR